MTNLYKFLCRLKQCLLLSVLLVIHSHTAQAQIITTVAGDGSHAETGNGGLAVNAGAPDPYGVCINAKGDIFFGGANVVRKVDAATGIVTRFAGTGTSDYSGDGGAATSATMKFPHGLCADTKGNIYISEYAGHRVRKVNAATNIITTVAGTGFEGFGGDNDLAVNAPLDQPHGICTDSKNNLYICDTKNSRIRKVDAVTQVITTIAGTGSISYSGDNGPAVSAGVPYPVSVCTDTDDNLYFAEVYSSYTCRVRKIDHTTGIVTTIAGYSSYAYSGDGGLAVNASLFDPTGVCVDNQGNVYISEYDDSRIRKIDAATGIINTLAGTGKSGYNGDCIPAGGAMINEPVSLCVDNDKNIYIADTYNNRIRKIIQSASLNTPVITIAANSTDACANSSITFTATITNADANSILQWKKNNQNAGAGNTSYTDKCKPGDVITCILTSSNVCNTNVVSSNSILLTGSDNALPVITIAADEISVCEGGTITFTAANKSNSRNPTYNWLIDGKEANSHDAIFTTGKLQSDATISCTMSVPVCGIPVTAASNSIPVAVSPLLTPTVNITTPKTTVCRESSITFTATTQNAGLHPSYQWKVNGVDAGTNSTQFIMIASAENDIVVSCAITAEAGSACYATTSGISNIITVKVAPKLSGRYFHIIPSKTTICEGETVSFTADFVMAGNGSFTWQINGKDVITYPFYTVFVTTALSDGDKVRCVYNSDDPCMPVWISDTASFAVNPSPVITLVPADTTISKGSQVQLKAIVQGDILTHTWSPADKLVSSQTLTPTTVPLTSDATYILRVTNRYHCEDTASVTIRALYKFLQMPSGFTPDGDGINDVFRLPPGVMIKLLNFSIYDRWGHLVFTTTDPAKGWNGAYHNTRLETGTYIYSIKAIDEEHGDISQKGAFTIIR